MKCRYDVAIIGAGPAGIAAAIQLKRMGIDALLFEKGRVGGLLNNAYLVENYPGFPSGIRGVDLVSKFKEHLRKWRVKVIEEDVTHLRKTTAGYVLTAGRNYRVHKVIVASGTRAKLPDGYVKGFGHRVLSEIYPIRNVRHKVIVIVGSGDAALDYALNLGRNNEVLLLHRGKHVKGLDLLYKRTKTSKNRIRCQPQTEIAGIKKFRDRMHIELSGKARMPTVVCDHVVYAIGREPALDFISGPMKRKFPKGDRHLSFIGDVKRGGFRQTATAVGDGVEAAMKLSKTLKTLKKHRTH